MAQHPKTPRAASMIAAPPTIQLTRVPTPRDRGRSTFYPPKPGVLDVKEWDLILQTGSNALLEGPPLALKDVLSGLESQLDCPHYTASALRWSLPSTNAGTLFLEHVADCSTEQQQQLQDWLDDASRRFQVITTTERSLFQLVEGGGFLSSLYYRLNTIHLNVNAPL